MGENSKEFTVDYVLSKVTHKGLRYYLIKWENYSFDTCTWEPETNLNPVELDEVYRTTKHKYSCLNFDQIQKYNNEFIRKIALFRSLWKTNTPFDNTIKVSSESENEFSDLENSLESSVVEHSSFGFINFNTNFDEKVQKINNHKEVEANNENHGFSTEEKIFLKSEKHIGPLYEKMLKQIKIPFHKNFPMNINLSAKAVSQIKPFIYVDRNIESDKMDRNLYDVAVKKEQITCTCDDFCVPGRCECISKTDAIYNVDKTIYGEFLSRPNALIVECSDNCGCHKGKCWNRVCQVSDTGYDFYGKPIYFEINSSEKGGLGLFTLSHLKKGSFVIEYVGELISEKEAQKRGTYYDAKKLSYIWSISIDHQRGRLLPSIDATFKGNVARFINHSCDPNLRAILFTSSGKIDFRHARVAFFARKPITPKSELTIDYNYVLENDSKKGIECRCGSKKCRGRML